MQFPRAFSLPIVLVALLATGCLNTSPSSTSAEDELAPAQDANQDGSESGSGGAAADDDDSSPAPPGDNQGDAGSDADGTDPDDSPESAGITPTSLALCSAAGRVHGNGMTATTCLAPWLIGAGVTTSSSLSIQVGPAYRIDPEGIL